MTNNEITVRNPEIFRIRKENTVYYGANQIWYPKRFQKMAGCGPTSCSNIIWYLSQTREKYNKLCSHDGRNYHGFLKLMEDIWEYVTPGLMGVKNLKMFTDGVLRYGKDKECVLTSEAFEVLENKIRNKIEIEAAFDFIEQALKDDFPVAFLNLSNGQLTNLESWHWVTIWRLDRAKGNISILDQNRIEEINLRLWLLTSLKGGGFVVIR